MRKIAYVMPIVVLSVFLAGSAFAAPSAKFTANVPNVTLVGQTDASQNWTSILTASLKTPNQKDLLIGVSLETGLYTQTKVAGKNGESSTSTALAGITVRVKIDGDIVNPGPITFDKRSQTLSAVLGGVIESCTDANGDGTIVIGEDCVVTDEVIELILDTMAAHHFNFVAANLTPGMHTILVEAAININSNVTSSNDFASAKALVGFGSLTVEEVRATNNPDGISFEFEF